MYYVVEGPYEVANCFAFWSIAVPDGKFAVVEDGELANGGYGPIALSKLFTRRETAEGIALAMNEDGSVLNGLHEWRAVYPAARALIAKEIGFGEFKRIVRENS